MKILFICGGLESGRDGVGDYLQRLGHCLVKMKHSVSILALNDEHIKNCSETEDAGVNLIRFPSVMPRKNRYESALRQISHASYDVVSLHYVGYAYSRFGVADTLLPLAIKIKRYTRLHVFFHETYIMPLLTKPQRFIISCWQRFSLVCFSLGLRNCSLHTSNPHYQKMLHGVGIRASVLPLFSNIAYRPSGRVVDVVQSIRSTCSTLAVYFGSLPSSQHLATFEKKIREVLNSGAGVVFLGGLGLNGSQWVRQCFPTDTENVVVTGKLTNDEVSAVLSICDFGIARNEVHLIGKSGTFAAMREHGLPVYVALSDSAKTQIDGCFFHIPVAGSLPSKSAPYSGVEIVADQFIKTLKAES